MTNITFPKYVLTNILSDKITSLHEETSRLTYEQSTKLKGMFVDHFLDNFPKEDQEKLLIDIIKIKKIKKFFSKTLNLYPSATSVSNFLNKDDNRDIRGFFLNLFNDRYVTNMLNNEFKPTSIPELNQEIKNIRNLISKKKNENDNEIETLRVLIKMIENFKNGNEAYDYLKSMKLNTDIFDLEIENYKKSLSNQINPNDIITDSDKEIFNLINTI